jgi:hypothetical protein
LARFEFLAPRKGKESLFNFIGVEDELNNKLFGKIQEKSDRIQKRVQIFSQELSLSEREILQHGFVDCINCAVWGIDGGDFQKDTIEAGEIMLDLLSRKKRADTWVCPYIFGLPLRLLLVFQLDIIHIHASAKIDICHRSDGECWVCLLGIFKEIPGNSVRVSICYLGPYTAVDVCTA